MEMPQDLLVNTEDDHCHDFPPYQTGFSGMHCALWTPILDPSALPLTSGFIRQMLGRRWNVLLLHMLQLIASITTVSFPDPVEFLIRLAISTWLSLWIPYNSAYSVTFLCNIGWLKGPLLKAGCWLSRSRSSSREQLQKSSIAVGEEIPLEAQWRKSKLWSEHCSITIFWFQVTRGTTCTKPKQNKTKRQICLVM